MLVKYSKLRKLFSDFWEERKHTNVPPIPLVLQNDATTLFTGSGMQPLIPYLLGETHPLGKRLYNIQPCFRAQDIDEVGDNRHDTFFEMMGNWSLGDYFKKEQIAWVYQFLVEVLKIPKERLYVTVFKGTKELPPDDYSLNIWKKLGIPEERISKYGSKNWWSRNGSPENMPSGEPGGPDSEIFYRFSGKKHRFEYGKKCHPNCDCGQFLEIGNSVFMEYKKNEDGSFSLLPKKNVDFGGGLERILAVLNDNPDIFLTDVYFPIIKKLEKITNRSYQDKTNKASLRIIADHIKGAVFLIKDGVLPSNKEQGYILRRIIRRASIKMHRLGKDIKEINSLVSVVDSVIDIYREIYFKSINTGAIKLIIRDEINKFIKTLKFGLKKIKKIKKINARLAFDLYQNFGFPLELTEEIFKEKGQKIDRKKFYQEFTRHKNLSRQSSVGKFKGGLANHSQQTIKYHTATHLIHQSLFDIIGKEVRQEGSNITNERLRFDFYSLKKPTAEEIKKVEEKVNEKIKEKLLVKFKILNKKEALKIKAKSFFREKYPDKVRVYFIGSYSKEFCGGPHVSNTGEIGKITIFKFKKIGSNLYRLYAK